MENKNNILVGGAVTELQATTLRAMATGSTPAECQELLALMRD